MRHRTHSLVAFAIPRALVLCLLAASGCVPIEQGPAEGTAAPDFRLARLGGGELALADHRGKVVVLDFWATWCVPCKAQARILEPLYEEYNARGVEILSINLEETEQEVRDYVDETPFPYPVLLDEAGEVGAQFGIVGLPTVVVIGREGEVAFSKIGVTGASELRETFERELG